MTASPETNRLPRLHLVTDDRVLEWDGFERVVERILRESGDRVALHLRGPGATGRRLWELGELCGRVARETGASLFVNDRIDVAMACGVSGVQLGRASFPPECARRLLGAAAIGVSVHGVSEALQAEAEGADFVIAGTLFQTPSHPRRSPNGVEWLRQLTDLRIPLIGIGGITVERVSEVIDAGAHGVAVIRGVWGAERPERAVQTYLAQME